MQPRAVGGHVTRRRTWKTRAGNEHRRRTWGLCCRQCFGPSASRAPDTVVAKCRLPAWRSMVSSDIKHLQRSSWICSLRLPARCRRRNIESSGGTLRDARHARAQWRSSTLAAGGSRQLKWSSRCLNQCVVQFRAPGCSGLGCAADDAIATRPARPGTAPSELRGTSGTHWDRSKHSDGMSRAADSLRGAARARVHSRHMSLAPLAGMLTERGRFPKQSNCDQSASHNGISRVT